jgi:hypothetical protein
LIAGHEVPPRLRGVPSYGWLRGLLMCKRAAGVHSVPHKIPRGALSRSPFRTTTE